MLKNSLGKGAETSRHRPSDAVHRRGQDSAAAKDRDVFSRIYSAIDYTNRSYVNSGADIRVRLAAIARVGYAELGDSDEEIRRLRNAGNKVGSGLNRLRTRYGADLVGLVVSSFDVCGSALRSGLGMRVQDKATSLNVRAAWEAVIRSRTKSATIWGCVMTGQWTIQ